MVQYDIAVFEKAAKIYQEKITSAKQAKEFIHQARINCFRTTYFSKHARFDFNKTVEIIAYQNSSK